MADNLLLKFRVKDSPYGVTRATLKALSEATDASETMVVHLALSRFAREVLPAYQPDDGPLTARQFSQLRKAAKAELPKGKLISRKTLF